MRKLPAVIFALFLFLSLAATLPAETESARADILFAKYYINWAWGFDFKGITVDSAGQVQAFVYDDTTRMPDFDRAALTAEQLNVLYQPGRKLVTTVAADKLQQMVELIPHAAVGSMSERVNEGNDMGTEAWVAYQMDSQTGLFKEIDLKDKGDWSSHNLATAAVELVDWLSGLQQ